MAPAPASQTDGGTLTLQAQGVAVALAADAPDDVHLLPPGAFTGRDGRSWRVDDMARVIAASMAEGQDLPIDYDHASDLAAREGRPAPAAGWITELVARDDGLWGRVKWTEAGRRAVQQQEYRYLSPVFYFQEATGQIEQLARAGLTNSPNLRLVALNSHQQETTMELAALLAALGVAEDTDEETAVAAVKALVAQQKDSRPRMPTAVCQALGIAEDADEAAAVTADNGLIAKQGGDPDPAKYVPMDAFKALQSQVAKLTAGGVEAKVDEAIQAGKLLPASRDWAIAYCSKDEAGFDEFVGNQPTILADGRVAPPGSGTEGSLSETELAVCRQTAVSEEDFKKAKAAEAARREVS